MAASVLGKRTRGAAGSPDTVISFRRRTRQCVLVNDENANPFVSHVASEYALSDSCMEADHLVKPAATAHNISKVPSVPLKHGTHESRLPLSPAKVTAHFKTARASPTTICHVEQIQLSTPKTPRHRDAFSNKVPATPRRHILVTGTPVTPSSRRTPFTPSSVGSSVYNQARQIFARSGSPACIVGREHERKELHDFLSSRVDSQSSGCMYVSGPPGTGKSALVSDVCERYRKCSSVSSAYVNCMSMKSTSEIYRRLIQDLAVDSEVLEGEEAETLKALFRSENSRMKVYLIVLDEIDHLLDLDLEVLYNLFQWSLEASSSLILIGIANALDLTDRLLPRLKSRRSKPVLLSFLPYRAAEISMVIATRLRSLLPKEASATGDCVPFVHPAAIHFISKKVASQSGDLRKAFDICRVVLDLAEADVREEHFKKGLAQQQPSPSRSPLSEKINLSSPISPPKTPAKRPIAFAAGPLNRLTPENAPKATIAHAARVTSSIFNTGTASRLKTINLQQRVVLCALLALEGRRRNASEENLFNTPLTPSKKRDTGATTIKSLYDTYKGLCKKDDMLHPLTATEFRDVVSGLEMLGLVEGSDGPRSGSSTFTVYGTPSKRRKLGIGAAGGDERRVWNCVGEKEMRDSVMSMGGGGAICLGILNGDGSVW